MVFGLLRWTGEVIRIVPSETYRGGEGGGRVQWSRGSVDSEKRLECVRVCVCGRLPSNMRVELRKVRK